MIGKRQHSSPIPENLACEISDATSQVRVSGNRRRGRLYNQPARHCPFFSLSLSHAHHHSFTPSHPRAPRSFPPFLSLFLSQRGSYANSRLSRTVRRELLPPEISRRNRGDKVKAGKLFRRAGSASRAFAEISSPARAKSLAGSTRFALGE